MSSLALWRTCSVGVKFDASDLKKIRGSIDRIKRDYLNKAPNNYKRAIIQSWRKGQTPVKNGRWDKPYSESYRRQIRKKRNVILVAFSKKTTPVNLKVTGTLWSALSVTRSGSKLTITINDELGDIHTNQGAGKAKAIREMLPVKEGQDFKKKINDVLQTLLERIVTRIVRS